MSGMAIKFTSLAQIGPTSSSRQTTGYTCKKPRISGACRVYRGAIPMSRIFCRWLPTPQWPHSNTPATIGSGGTSVGSGGCGKGKSGVGTGSGVSPGGGVS
jgi:hypothetical protein